ncbi:MAG: ATP-binding protein, partial [Thermodesulfobacteriota bacterium]
STLLNLKLSEQIRNFKEMEAFRTMSAFIMHDLKNLASSLSLTVQNLPVLYDNPEFRQDAVRISQQSLEKINNICAGLSALSQKIEIKKVKTNLDELIINTLATLNISASSLLYQADIINSPSTPDQKEKREKKLSADRHRYIWPLSNGGAISVIYNPQLETNIMIDPEQIQKVLANLLLNSRDALKKAGEIRISTRKLNGWVEISVSDNGCGMSKEFLEKSLFRPFKTTKKKGMGIGLFQSKMIIEAHGGRIEVESQENLGTTFRIYLLS